MAIIRCFAVLKDLRWHVLRALQRVLSLTSLQLSLKPSTVDLPVSVCISSNCTEKERRGSYATRLAALGKEKLR